MKKIASYILCLCVAAAVLSACGNKVHVDAGAFGGGGAVAAVRSDSNQTNNDTEITDNSADTYERNEAAQEDIQSADTNPYTETEQSGFAVNSQKTTNSSSVEWESTTKQTTTAQEITTVQPETTRTESEETEEEKVLRKLQGVWMTYSSMATVAVIEDKNLNIYEPKGAENLASGNYDYSFKDSQQFELRALSDDENNGNGYKIVLDTGAEYWLTDDQPDMLAAYWYQDGVRQYSGTSSYGRVDQDKADKFYSVVVNDSQAEGTSAGSADISDMLQQADNVWENYWTENGKTNYVGFYENKSQSTAGVLISLDDGKGWGLASADGKPVIKSLSGTADYPARYLWEDDDLECIIDILDTNSMTLEYEDMEFYLYKTDRTDTYLDMYEHTSDLADSLKQLFPEIS